MSEAETQRIDKWLWHARFARTRGAAQRLALSGHVRLNRDKVTVASRTVRAGDVLTLASAAVSGSSGSVPYPTGEAASRMRSGSTATNCPTRQPPKT
jgi:ribosomal protein S4